LFFKIIYKINIFKTYKWLELVIYLPLYLKKNVHFFKEFAVYSTFFTNF